MVRRIRRGGAEVASVKVPTLVADGAEDALDPVINDR
jgi:hypothetical protein